MREAIIRIAGGRGILIDAPVTIGYAKTIIDYRTVQAGSTKTDKEVNVMRKQLLKWLSLVCVVISLARLPLVAAPHLTDWDDLEALITAEYDALAVSAPCFPPAELRFNIALPPLTFDPTAFSAPR